MRRVSVAEARQKLRALLEEVAAGKQVVVLRRGREVARLVPPSASKRKLPDLGPFRRSIRMKGEFLSATVMRSRREGRY
jgi:prevent-host-death family protein